MPSITRTSWPRLDVSVMIVSSQFPFHWIPCALIATTHALLHPSTPHYLNPRLVCLSEHLKKRTWKTEHERVYFKSCSLHVKFLVISMRTSVCSVPEVRRLLSRMMCQCALYVHA